MSDARTTAAERKIPGRARAAATILAEYREQRSRATVRLAERDLGPLVSLFYPDEHRLTIWRVELDCGFVREFLSPGDDPPNPSTKDPFSTAPAARQRLNPGEVFCGADDHPHRSELASRRIVGWEDREEYTEPADPVDDPYGFGSELWAKLRHPQPRARAQWTVTLECGHVTGQSTDLEFDPALGPRYPSAARLEQMRAEFEENDTDGHFRAYLARGWPMPDTERDCSTCRYARPLVAYERVGPLVAAAKKPADPEARRTRARRRLERLESEAARLRAELDDA